MYLKLILNYTLKVRIHTIVLVMAYLKMKDTIKAIEYYKKALSINPENRGAKRAVKKLTKRKKTNGAFKYPIGKPNIPVKITSNHILKWISILE